MQLITVFAHALLFDLGGGIQASAGRMDLVEPTPVPLIEGLKHKMLVHLFKKKKLEAASGKQEALKHFHYVFENMVDLLMWKVSHLAPSRMDCSI